MNYYFFSKHAEGLCIYILRKRKKSENKPGTIDSLRASLETPISHGILIFPREFSSFSLGKMRIPWEIGVSKLALRRSKTPE
jgi:hypothetical protein